jgi:DNA-binding XRE family transcriptional regulator
MVGSLEVTRRETQQPDLADLEAPLRLTQELLADLGRLSGTVLLMRRACGHMKRVKAKARQRAVEFGRKLSLRNQHLRDYFIRTNQEYKLKLFPIYTVGSSPMQYNDMTVARFRAGLERERALLQREMAGAITSACGASGGHSVEHASRAEALDRPAGPDVRAERQRARTLPSPSPPAGNSAVRTLTLNPRMSKEKWVRDGWPGKLKQARGSRTQKEAARECGVSVETYKKWEQGAHPPNCVQLPSGITLCWPHQ